MVSGFFSNVAVAWFVGLFVAPRLSSEFDALTMVRYGVNMIGTLFISLLLLKEEKNDR